MTAAGAAPAGDGKGRPPTALAPTPGDLRRHYGAYGVDGSVGALATLTAATATVAATGLRHWRAGRRWLAGAELLPAAAVAAAAAAYLQATRRGKFAVWAEILADLGLRGDEAVLDLGCGRGAVLTMAARLLPAGHAVGVDRWTGDQSGNRPASTRANLACEGVADRAVLVTADMRALPFADRSFDVVVSSLAIHNVDRHGPPLSPERWVVVDEAVRVLRPGGRLVVADLFAVHDYERWLHQHGMADVRRASTGWRLWFAPGIGAEVVSAVRPAGGPRC